MERYVDTAWPVRTSARQVETVGRRRIADDYHECLIAALPIPGYEGGLFPGCIATPILQLSTGTIGTLVK